MTLAAYSIAWLAGVSAAAMGWGDYWILAPFIGAGLLKGFALAGKLRLGLAAASLAVVFLLGLVAYDAYGDAGSTSDVARFNDTGDVVIRGTVAEEPEQRDTNQRLHLKITHRLADGEWVASDGGVLVTVRLFPRFHHGDEIELEGRLVAPERYGDFDYREYLARQGIQSLTVYPHLTRTGTGGGSDLVRALTSVRRSMGESLERSLPEPESALARGILLGERASIPRDVTSDFNDAGISHLVAISGYNVMLVACLTLSALSWLLGRRVAIIASFPAVLLFALFVGGSPSVLRALAMAYVVLGARLAGRPNSARNGVWLAGAVLTAIQPAIVKDVSFQLSFAAAAGIVLFAQGIEERLRGVFGERLAALAEPVSVTLAASIAAQPIIALQFGRFSILSLPANLLALSSYPVILIGSLATALLGIVNAGFGRLVGEVTYLPLAYLIWVGEVVASIPGAVVTSESLTSGETALLCVAHGVVLVLTRAIWRRPKTLPEVRRLSPVMWTAVVMLVVAGFVWRDTLSASERELTVTILDVGQGDAILIETPAGQRVLVDGGPSVNQLAQALGRELPVSAHKLDLMVLTHGQDDHVTGLVGALDRFEVGTAMTTPLKTTSAAYLEWRDSLERHGVPLREAKAGQWIDLGDGVRLEVLGPPERLLTGTDDDVNNSSVVLRLVYRDISFLLTGDLAAEGEQALLANGGSLLATVLKVGHHGSDGSTTTPFLSAVNPKLAVVSVGGDNTYGHPSPTTRLRLKDVPLLRTDEHGDLRLQTDGKRLEVFVQRGGIRNLVKTR